MGDQSQIAVLHAKKKQRTRPILANAASRSRVSTLWLRPETWRLFPGLCLPLPPRLINCVPLGINSQDTSQYGKENTDPLSPSLAAPGLLLLLDLLGPSPPPPPPPPLSRPGERPPPFAFQLGSSVVMTLPFPKPASWVGMLIPLLEGAMSWDCHAEEGGSENEMSGSHHADMGDQWRGLR